MTTRGDEPTAGTSRPSAPTWVEGAPPPPAGDDGPLPVGNTFAGRYHVRRRIGTGGMGAVYQAFDTVLSEDVAIKMIRPEILADPAAAADVERRFKRELLMGRRVSHPCVVRVHDFGEAQGLRYLTMSYVDGQDLARVLETEGPLSASRAVRIGRRLGTALAAVHAAGVIHRDLKPANVMLGRGDQVWLTDFGIARLVGESTNADASREPGAANRADAGASTAPGPSASPRLGTLTTLGARIGTPEFMAPEQAAGARVDERTDVYGLGLVLYDLLTGGARRQRYGSAETELQARSLDAPHVRVQAPEVPDALDAVLARALDPEPSRRYASAAAMVDALAAIEDGVAADRTGAGATTRSVAGSEPAGTAPAALVGRRTWLVAAAVGALAIALGGFVALRGDSGGATGETARVASGAAATTTGGASTEAAPARSVAVLPFADLSEKGDQRYFADGLAEELLDALSTVEELRVPARRSSFQFDGTDTEVAEIGRQLGVAHLLEGSVRRAGERLRVTATLVRTADGAQVWTQSFERKAADVFAVQDEIADAVVAALAATLPRGTAQYRTANPEAHDLYLRAKSLGRTYAPESQRAAVELLRRAIALDPSFARA